jgi:hypothetical protein
MSNQPNSDSNLWLAITAVGGLIATWAKMIWTWWRTGRQNASTDARQATQMANDHQSLEDADNRHAAMLADHENRLRAIERERSQIAEMHTDIKWIKQRLLQMDD